MSNQKSKFNVKNVIPAALDGVKSVDPIVEAFLQTVQPLQAHDVFHVLVDARTKARYCECHVPASKLVPLSTTDVPLDPEEQPEYRANREIVTSHMAFERMQQDANQRRSFIMPTFAQRDKTAVSVGENAVLVLNARKR